MKLLIALAVATVVVLAACGDDDGPAADIGGVWSGQMESTNAAAATPHSGPVCIEIEQDGREITGRVVFQVGPHPMGGRIANETLSFVWSSGASPTDPAPPVSFDSGGTFAGTVATESMSGTWNSLDGDNGTWSASRGTARSCG